MPQTGKAAAVQNRIISDIIANYGIKETKTDFGPSFMGVWISTGALSKPPYEWMAQASLILVSRQSSFSILICQLGRNSKPQVLLFDSKYWQFRVFRLHKI